MTTMLTAVAPGSKAPGLVPVVETITPRRAAELLTLNRKNRTCKPAVVQRYAKDMTEGRWGFNGAPILISDTGILLDGQHRLQAIVDSGVTLALVMIYDLPEATRDTVDTGSVRRAADVLKFSGYSDETTLAAIARIIMSRQQGMTSISGYRPSNVDVRDYVLANPGIVNSVPVARSANRQVPAAPSVIGAAHHLCAQVDEEAAEDFYVRRLINLEGMPAGDPVAALRRRLSQMQDRTSYTAKGEQLRYILLAWNIDRDGRSITKLQGPVGGWNRSNFPDPR